MEDALTIVDLEVHTRIGVPEPERAKEQKLLVTVEMTLDVSKAAASDDVTLSINYADVAEDVKLLAKTERKTIERFAEEIAQMILKKYKTMEVTVTVKKFILPDAKHAEIKITRTR